MPKNRVVENKTAMTWPLLISTNSTKAPLFSYEPNFIDYNPKAYPF